MAKVLIQNLSTRGFYVGKIFVKPGKLAVSVEEKDAEKLAALYPREIVIIDAKEGGAKKGAVKKAAPAPLPESEDEFEAGTE